jgi:hypothetical protein
MGTNEKPSLLIAAEAEKIMIPDIDIHLSSRLILHGRPAISLSPEEYESVLLIEDRHLVAMLL